MGCNFLYSHLSSSFKKNTTPTFFYRKPSLDFKSAVPQTSFVSAAAFIRLRHLIGLNLKFNASVLLKLIAHCKHDACHLSAATSSSSSQDVGKTAVAVLGLHVRLCGK